MNDEYGAFNAEFATDLKWGEFKPELAVVTPDEDDELPFSGGDETEDWA